jgi:DNA-binding transcriptional ArsR family regulator
MTENYDAIFENAKKIKPSLAWNAITTGQASQLLEILMKYDKNDLHFKTQMELCNHMIDHNDSEKLVGKNVSKLQSIISQHAKTLKNAWLITINTFWRNSVYNINKSLIDLYAEAGKSLETTKSSQKDLPEALKINVQTIQESLNNILWEEESPTIKGINSIATYARVLWHHVVQKILQTLEWSEEKPLNVTDIFIKLRTVQQPQISHYLTILRKVDLVKTKPDGKEVYYSLNKEALIQAWEQFALLAPHIPAQTENIKK